MARTACSHVLNMPFGGKFETVSREVCGKLMRELVQRPRLPPKARSPYGWRTASPSSGDTALQRLSWTHLISCIRIESLRPTSARTRSLRPDLCATWPSQQASFAPEQKSTGTLCSAACSSGTFHGIRESYWELGELRLWQQLSTCADRWISA